MRIHIGWAALSCLGAFIIGTSLGAYSSIAGMQGLLDVQVGGVVIEQRALTFKATNLAFEALESEDHDRAKHIMAREAAADYAMIKQIKEAMESNIEGRLMTKKLEEAEAFLQQNKNASALVFVANGEHLTTRSSGRPPAAAATQLQR